MRTYHNFLAPSLTPNAVVDFQLPDLPRRGTPIATQSIVRQLEVGEWKESESLGVVKRIAVDQERGIVALADTTHRITLTSLPEPRSPDESDDKEQEQEDDKDLKVQGQFQVKPARKSDSWVGLEVLPGGILSTLSSGLISLHPTPQSSSTPPTTSQSGRLPAGLTCSQTINSGSQIVVAGKEVDVSIFDVEKVLERGPGDGTGKEVEMGTGGKRKKGKGELEVGEVWRARNLPNNGLSLRTPIHHLCLTVLPTSTSNSTGSTTTSTTASTSIVTGTKSGHVRRYDTRQRKPVDGWKVAREGGVGAVQAGLNEHELFFADTSSLLGSMDLRTGKLLYAYPSQTSTVHSLLPLPTLSTYKPSRFDKKIKRDHVGLVSLSSDATLRACSTTAPPGDSKKNVTRGEVLGMIGGVGSGGFGYYGSSEMDELEGEEEEVAVVENEDGVEGEEDEEEVWDDMAVVEEDEGVGSGDSDEEESSEDEAPQKKRKGGKR